MIRQFGNLQMLYEAAKKSKKLANCRMGKLTN